MIACADTAGLSQFIPVIDAIFYNSDLSTVSVKKVRTGLQAQLGVDLSAQKVPAPCSANPPPTSVR